jgi:tRNA pseudouridine55 synthase
LATGVLITGIGKGTKVLQKFLDCTKSYDAVVLFGVSTDTYDTEGKILARAPYEHITKAKVEEALKSFRGKGMQKPPMFSALRVQGKRLYEYAREGSEVPVEIKKRPVDVSELEILEWMDGGTHNYKWPTLEADTGEKLAAERAFKNPDEELVTDAKPRGKKRGWEAIGSDCLVQDMSTPSQRPRHSSPKSLMAETVQSPDASEELKKDVAQQISGSPLSVPEHQASEKLTFYPPAVKLRMTVTSGFYVRSLCHDLGQAVGSMAIMSELVRTRQGEYQLGRNVLEYSDIEKGEDVWGTKVAGMLEEWTQNQATTET